MMLRTLLLVAALAAGARAADLPEMVALTVARRGTPRRPAEIAMASVPLAEIRDWLGQRAGRSPAHVELEVDPGGRLPTLHVIDPRGRSHASLARFRDLTRARALLEAAMARPAEAPVQGEAVLAGVPRLAPGG